MKIFTFSHCYRLFRVWLIAIACQTGKLFSQLEDPYNENYFSSIPSETNQHTYQTNYNEKFSDYYSQGNPQYSVEGPQNGQWPAISKNEWQNQEEIQPDYYSQDNPQYPVEGPENGQWPVISENEWQN